METHKYHQPELELKHNSEKSQKKIEAISAVGRFAVEAVSAIGHSIMGKNKEVETLPQEDRIVIDLIEGSTVYGSLMRPDGNDHQLVFALDGIHLVRNNEI
ncbi:MAG: hypothetical protein WCI60_02700 [bacterium]